MGFDQLDEADAREFAEACEEAIRALDHATGIAQRSGALSPELRRTVGKIIADIDLDLLEVLWGRFPGLRRTGLDPVHPLRPESDESP